MTDRRSASPRIGVLALQGSFALHRRALERLGIRTVEVRKAAGLEGLSGIVIPGGESSTMLKLLLEEDLFEPLREFAHAGGAVYGTCAGAILMANSVLSPRQPSLGLLDIEIRRNGYGRQRESHVGRTPCPELGDEHLPLVMIRAPVITGTGRDVEILATHRGAPVLVRQGRALASTFHPELTTDLRVHALFARSAGAPEQPPGQH